MLNGEECFSSHMHTKKEEERETDKVHTKGDVLFKRQQTYQKLIRSEIEDCHLKVLSEITWNNNNLSQVWAPEGQSV